MIRILHVVGIMDRGGIETWLIHVLRNTDRQRFRMDFVVDTESPGDYDQEIYQMGSTIYNAGSRRSIKFGSRFKQILTEHGPYDIVHSHVNHFNGTVMRLSKQCCVPMRISHSHTDTTAKECKARIGRQMMVRFLHHQDARHRTYAIAASEPAAESLFGVHWRQRANCRVLHCGIDLKPFALDYDRASVRRELNIPENAWVIGHVGRLLDVKNHQLILRTFAAISTQAEDAYLLLLGDGPLRADLEKMASALGIRNRVNFAGVRNDVPRLLCAALDAFVFPSKFEGLGIALIEAQAAGLPSLVSTVVPKEADVIPRLITRLSIDEDWSQPLLKLRRHVRNRAASYQQILRSDFGIEGCVSQLEAIYGQVTELDPSGGVR